MLDTTIVHRDRTLNSEIWRRIRNSPIATATVRIQKVTDDVRIPTDIGQTPTQNGSSDQQTVCSVD